MTLAVLKRSLQRIFEFYEAIIVNEEFDNFYKRHVLKFVKSNVRNIRVIFEIYDKYWIEGWKERCDLFKDNIENINYFFKNTIHEVKRIEDESKRLRVFYNFVYIEFSNFLNNAEILFDLDTDYRKKLQEIIDDVTRKRKYVNEDNIQS